MAEIQFEIKENYDNNNDDFQKLFYEIKIRKCNSEFLKKTYQ